MSKCSVIHFLFGCLILLSLDAAGQTDARLTGTWTCSHPDENQVLILHRDGTGALNGEPLKYEVQGKSLTVTTRSGTIVYSFRLEGNRLYIAGGDIEGQRIFFKEAEVYADESSYSATSRELIGLWSGEGEIIEFRPDGVCRYNEELFSYKLSQGHLLLETPNGTITFAFRLKAGQLVLTANGQQAIYARLADSPKVSPSGKKGRVPADLVGQWCYMRSSSGTFSGRCITLNADGTYTYAAEHSMSVQSDEVKGGTASQTADAGTWYVLGDRLYYESTTRGSGSYRLERRNHPKNVNDPMIVLDDEPFVTATQRPPWR